MPFKIAGSEVSLQFVPKIEQEVLNFLSTSLKHNTVDPTRGLNLDLTIGEAIKISQDSEKLENLY
jgi:hypothetical protein